MAQLHSITLDLDRCIGCTDCIKRCPTEAIRVRNSKAVIMDELCIDCGMCIRVCNYRAKMATTDPINRIHKFKYRVALVEPSLFTQFKKIRNPNIVLTALKKLGFSDAFDISPAVRQTTALGVKMLKDGTAKKPAISTTCPAIINLVQMRFPTLMENFIPIIPAKELMARYVKSHLLKQGIPESHIGIFYISPCGAKVTDTRYPQVISESLINGVVPMKEVFHRLLPIINSLKPDEIETLMSGDANFISLAETAGEGIRQSIYNQIYVDGIEEVIEILERLDNDKLDVDFIGCMSCVNGCLGGALTVENSFVSTTRKQKIANYVKNRGEVRELDIVDPSIDFLWEKTLESRAVTKLDEDLSEALKKMERMERIYDVLPHIDCGSCGAPTCRALAEDIVKEQGNIEDCIFMLRNKVRMMAEQMVTLAEKMPPSIKKLEDMDDDSR